MRLRRLPLLLLLSLLPASASRAGAPPAEAWLAAAREGIAASEYGVGRNRRGLQAPNRRHDLRTYFSDRGIRVEARRDPGGAALLELELARWGREAALEAAAPGALGQRGARVEIQRPGLVEWFENGPAGLEHGFRVVARPAGEGALLLELVASGARARAVGDAVHFRTPGGRVLRYAKLVVRDAEGRRLEAGLEVPAADRVRIAIEDAGAVYPLDVDPLLTGQPDAELDSDQSGATLGFSVASAGDVNGDSLDDAIVGAPLYDAGEADEGAAFVFLGGAAGVGDGDPGSAHAQLESDEAGARLGYSVAGAGDVDGDYVADAIAGAPFLDGVGAGAGAAFVFHGSRAVLARGDPPASSRRESNQEDARFGYSVASAGDVDGDGHDDVIVGAVFYDGGEVDEGAAFVFLGCPSGIGDGDVESAHARFEGNQADAHLGFSVASAGDVNADGFDDVIVGARLYDDGEVDEGAAFVFLGSESGLADGDPVSADARLQSDQADARLGFRVASAGDVDDDGYDDVVVGAVAYDDAGAAFVFHGGPAGPGHGSPATADARLASEQEGSQFGWFVSAGDVDADGYGDVLVGAPGYDAGEVDEGAVFVFRGGAGGLGDAGPATAHAQLEGDQAGAGFGYGVGAGDVNGDAYDDVLVGAWRYDAGETDEGAAFVFHGGPAGLADTGAAAADTRIEADQTEADLGGSVASAGDVNGDGFDDLVVGARRYDASEIDSGGAFLFLGAPGGIADASVLDADVALDSQQVSALIGYSVASAGDVNGDGRDDLLVGAIGWDEPESSEGVALLYLPEPAGPGAAAVGLAAGAAWAVWLSRRSRSTRRRA